MSLAYALGFVFGVAVAAGIIWLVKKFIWKGQKAKYDERQLVEQGKAGKIGMYALMIYNVCYGLIDMVFGIENVSTFTAMVGGCIFAVLVYACVCIWNEAYFPINQSSKKWIILVAGLGILNIVIAVMNRSHLESILDGYAINFFAGIMCIVVDIVAIAKFQLVKKAAVEDDADDEDEIEA
ncbi:MAG: hypothetical protein KBS68_05070 [Clostridiales bacterium]|nr:hypothetical protein [Candidatus Crickella merdequi]